MHNSSEKLNKVYIIVEMIVISGLSLIQSGLFNKCINRTGNPGATGNQVLVRNLLNMEYTSFIAELQIIAQEVRHRARVN